MEPLGSTKRALLLGITTALFIIAIPILFLYVTGFRLSYTNKDIVVTGGIYTHRQNISGETTISGNSLNEAIKTSLTLTQGLAPGIYTVTFDRVGYTSWKKQVSVVAQKVTDIHPFQIPEKPAFEIVEKTIQSTDGKAIKNPEYATALALFAPEKETVKKKTDSLEIILPNKSRDNVHLFFYNHTLYAEWIGSADSLPHFFCDAPTVCSFVIPVARNLPATSEFDFFPNREDIVLLTKEDGLYASEIDPYGGRNETKIFDGKNLAFRVDGSSLFIQNKDTINIMTLE